MITDIPFKYSIHDTESWRYEEHYDMSLVHPKYEFTNGIINVEIDQSTCSDLTKIFSFKYEQQRYNDVYDEIIKIHKSKVLFDNVYYDVCYLNTSAHDDAVIYDKNTNHLHIISMSDGGSISYYHYNNYLYVVCLYCKYGTYNYEQAIIHIEKIPLQYNQTNKYINEYVVHNTQFIYFYVNLREKTSTIEIVKPRIYKINIAKLLFKNNEYRCKLDNLQPFYIPTQPCATYFNSATCLVEYFRWYLSKTGAKLAWCTSIYATAWNIHIDEINDIMRDTQICVYFDTRFYYASA